MTNMSDLTNNKQREQLCILVVKREREREKKKRKQLIIARNPTLICLHVPHHVEEGTTVFLVRWQMTRFGYRETSHTSPK